MTVIITVGTKTAELISRTILHITKMKQIKTVNPPLINRIPMIRDSCGPAFWLLDSVTDVWLLDSGTDVWLLDSGTDVWLT